KYCAQFIPFCLSRSRALRGGRGFHACQCFAHVFFSHGHGTFSNRTATALRPSWYCNATTCALDCSFRLCCINCTSSPYSGGSVERKIACSLPQYSSTTCSCTLAPLPREAITQTWICVGSILRKKCAS